MIVSVFVTLMVSWLHPLHISVTEIKFDVKDKELEISSRIFIDDLEAAIRKQVGRPSLDILNSGKDIKTDPLVSNYLATRLTVKVDGKAVKVKYLGYEIEGDALIAYLYAPGVKKMKSIEVFNSSITELYDDQYNLVHITLGEETRSMRLMRNKLFDKIMFEK